METIVALDIGTTGTKAVLVDRTGKVLGTAYEGYGMHVEGRVVEQNPADWWKAAQKSLRSLIQSAPADVDFTAVAVSGQMQDVILVGAEEVVAPAILYSDARAQAEADVVLEKLGIETLISATGNLQDATSLLAKLLWLKDHQPEVYRTAQTLLIGAHDYVIWKLCGAAAADYTTAATTGLLDLQANRWDLSHLEQLGIRTDWLPKLSPSAKQAGQVSASAAQLTGLPEGLPVFHGIGDAAATTLGAGAGEPGRSYIYLGTSGWLASTRAGSPVDPRTGIFNLRHPDAQRLILIGPLITAAGNFEWLRRQFGDLETVPAGADSDPYALLGELAAQAPAGSSGLLYMPHLAGERAPFRDTNARGVFFGLSTTTTRMEMYRAVLEGVAFAMRSIRDVMYPSGETAGLSLVGGGAKSKVWPQIFADIFGCRVMVLADPGNVAARGAAISVGKALGWFADYAPQEYFPIERIYEPEQDNVYIYDKLFRVYQSLYPALKESFHQLSTIL